MTPTTMTALVATRRDNPSLNIGTVDMPVPAAGDVLIAVSAAAITFAELTWDELWQRDPVVPSHEMSGAVVSVGAGVTEWVVGDEVFALVRFDRQGAAAQYVTVPAADLAHRPDSVSHVVAAALPLAGLTAWQALVDHTHVKAGDEVLVHGGAGGVGGFAVQLAARLGANVTATARTADADQVRAFGARRVIDFGTERFDEETGRYDVVIDTVSGQTLHRSYPVVRPGGTLVTLSAPPDANRATQYGVDARFFIVTPDRAALDSLAALVASGALTVPLAATFPLAEGAAAFASGGRSDRAPGKTVLIVQPD